jgi:PmbA protein
LKSIDELHAWAGRAIELSKKSGAHAVRVGASAARSFKLKTRDGKTELLTESLSMELSVEIFADGRYGSFSTSDRDEKSLASFVGKAVDLVKLTDRDEAWGLPEKELLGPLSTADLELCDDRLAESMKDRAEDLCTAVTSAARKEEPRSINVEASFSESHARSVLLTTDGFSGRRESTLVGLGCGLHLEDQGSRKQSGDDWRAWRRWSDMQPAGIVGTTAAGRAKAMLGAAPLKTGEVPVVVVNYWGDHLTGMLLRTLGGATIHRKMSCMDDKKGKKIAPEFLTLADDPLLVRGLGSRSYDDEGMAAGRMPVIEKGVLKNFLLSTYWARKLDTLPTTAGSSNIVFEPGKRTGEEMARSLDRGILINDFIGGNLNTLTGDFSVGIRGFLYEKGKLVQPLSEMNLSGNLLQVLAKLEEVGSDPYPFMQIRSPAMRFGPLLVSGLE